MGTPEFAENIFRKFYNTLKDKIEIIAVITAQDKPVGRKQVLTPPPVKKWAQENGLPVFQPDKIRNPEWVQKIQELSPELIVLTAFGQIIPQEILDIPKYGALNIHPSLLPKYRGASPIQSVILCGETETGVCLMIMDKDMDHGPILGISKLESLNPKITYAELIKKLSDLGAELLIRTLPDWIEGKIKAREQDHNQATFCKLIKREDGKIQWDKNAEEIERMIRALNPWPGTYCEFESQKSKIKSQNDSAKLKILDADTINKNTDHKVGEVFLDENRNLCVQTGNGFFILKQVQLEGKNPMTAKDFLNGHKEIIGTILK
jgi:methionyl-tRNA formyltransferase